MRDFENMQEKKCGKTKWLSDFSLPGFIYMGKSGLCGRGKAMIYIGVTMS